MSYDPTQKYIWSPDEKIELTGQEFAMVVNAVRSILNLPEAPAIILADKANSALDNVMAKNVEEGKIKPAPTQLSVNNDEEGND